MRFMTCTGHAARSERRFVKMADFWQNGLPQPESPPCVLDPHSSAPLCDVAPPGSPLQQGPSRRRSRPDDLRPRPSARHRSAEGADPRFGDVPGLRRPGLIAPSPMASSTGRRRPRRPVRFPAIRLSRRCARADDRDRRQRQVDLRPTPLRPDRGPLVGRAARHDHRRPIRRRAPPTTPSTSSTASLPCGFAADG